MEIEQLRKELDHLLENVVDHSKDFTDRRQIPSLEIGVVLAKINKMQEKLIVLRHLIQTEEQNRQRSKGKRETPNEVVIEKAVEVEVIEKKIEEVQEPKVEVVEGKEEVIEAIIENPIIITDTSNSVADQIQHAPINKLVDAFTLNDRYLYANELFNKDMSAFNEMIKTIDDFASIDEAQTLFNQRGTTYNWDTENQLVIDFMNLIERRFS